MVVPQQNAALTIPPSQSIWVRIYLGLLSPSLPSPPLFSLCFPGLPKQSTMNRLVETTEMYGLTDLEARSRKSNCRQGHGPTESARERPVPGLSPHFWWSADNHWWSSACGRITPISAFVFTWSSPCLQTCVWVFLSCKDTNHIGLGAHPTPV